MQKKGRETWKEVASSLLLYTQEPPQRIEKMPVSLQPVLLRPHCPFSPHAIDTFEHKLTRGMYPGKRGPLLLQGAAFHYTIPPLAFASSKAERERESGTFCTYATYARYLKLATLPKLTHMLYTGT